MKGCVFLPIDFLKNCSKGLLLSIIAAAVLVMLFGGVCFTMDDPKAYIGVFGLASLYVSAFAGGLASAKANGKNGLLAGLATGLVFTVLTVALSFLFSNGHRIGGIKWLMLFLVCIVSGIGGYLGVPSSKKKKKHYAKKKRNK